MGLSSIFSLSIDIKKKTKKLPILLLDLPLPAVHRELGTPNQHPPIGTSPSVKGGWHLSVGMRGLVASPPLVRPSEGPRELSRPRLSPAELGMELGMEKRMHKGGRNWKKIGKNWWNVGKSMGKRGKK